MEMLVSNRRHREGKSSTINKGRFGILSVVTCTKRKKKRPKEKKYINIQTSEDGHKMTQNNLHLKEVQP